MGIINQLIEGIAIFQNSVLIYDQIHEGPDLCPYDSRCFHRSKGSPSTRKNQLSPFFGDKHTHTHTCAILERYLGSGPAPWNDIISSQLRPRLEANPCLFSYVSLIFSLIFQDTCVFFNYVVKRLQTHLKQKKHVNTCDLS